MEPSHRISNALNSKKPSDQLEVDESEVTQNLNTYNLNIPTE